MKKTTIGMIATVGISLFSLQLGSLSVQAEEAANNTDVGVVETLPGEGVPDVGTEISGGETEIESPAPAPEQPTDTPEQPGNETEAPEPELPEPTLPADPFTGTETPDSTLTNPEPTTPTEQPETPDPGTTDDSSTDVTDLSDHGTTETPTDSSTEGTTPTDPTKEEPKQPTEQPKEEKPTEPAKEVTVSVNPTGEITTDQTPGTAVPIVTSNIDEITHVPTPATPLKAASGQTIVGVQDGVPLVQNNQGNLVKDSSIPVKQLASGNIQVETADGQTKVLPKTGEETRAALSVLGLFFVSLAGFFGYKRKKA